MTLNRRDYYSAIPQLEDTITSLTDYITVSEGKIQIKIADLYGNVSTLTQTAESIEGRVEDAEGNIGDLELTAQGLDTKISTKRRVFTTTPTPPYDVGDLWTQGENGDIKYCITAKTDEQSYSASDWDLASKYTDDTQALLEATARKTLIRDKDGGTITAYVGQTYGVYTNALGSVDIVKLSWDADENPTVTDTIVSYGDAISFDDTLEFTIGNASRYLKWYDSDNDNVADSLAVVVDSMVIGTDPALKQGDNISDLTNDSGYQTSSDVSSAISGKADSSSVIASAVSVYYRSTTHSTPSINTSTTIGTSSTTDNAWEYVMPQPKRNRYFYICEKFIYGDGSVGFSTVRELSSETYASKWISEADNTYIDGGRIYANSVTASQIDTSTITVGSLSDGSNVIVHGDPITELVNNGTYTTGKVFTATPSSAKTYTYSDALSYIGITGDTWTDIASISSGWSPGDLCIMEATIYDRDDAPCKFLMRIVSYSGTTLVADNLGLTMDAPASKYVTKISGYSGITVHDASDTSNFAQMASSGLDVYVGSTSRAFFGSTARIGTSSGYNTTMSSSTLGFNYGGTNIGGITMYYSSGTGDKTLTLGGSETTETILSCSGDSSVQVNTSDVRMMGNVVVEGGETGYSLAVQGIYPTDTQSTGAAMNVTSGYIRSPFAYNNPASSSTANVRIVTGSGNDQYCLAMTASSSRRYKEDIEDISEEFAPELLYDLPVRQFRYKEGYAGDDGYDRPLIPGFIAEEVEEHYPAAVEYSGDHEVESWAERILLPPMLALIQKQKTQIDDLKERVSVLEKE